MQTLAGSLTAAGVVVTSIGAVVAVLGTLAGGLGATIGVGIAVVGANIGTAGAIIGILANEANTLASWFAVEIGESDGWFQDKSKVKNFFDKARSFVADARDFDSNLGTLLISLFPILNVLEVGAFITTGVSELKNDDFESWIDQAQTDEFNALGYK
jgi:hypothetical protein